MATAYMVWTSIGRYKTPDGFDDILMSSDGEVLTGLWFDWSPGNAKHGVAEESSCCFSATKDTKKRNSNFLASFRETCRWLDIYFSGHEPDFTPSYRIDALTPFRREVVGEMLKIPFGATTTYGDIAATLARRHGIARMSARAVGGAVGWNPICLIIPCHRVMGANGAITGYGGGIHNKIALLKHEAMLKRKENRIPVMRISMETTATNSKNNLGYPGATAPGFMIGGQCPPKKKKRFLQYCKQA